MDERTDQNRRLEAVRKERGRRDPVYRASLRDREGFPTVVVAGPDRERVWLYGHGPATPTVLRLHRPVVPPEALTQVATRA